MAAKKSRALPTSTRAVAQAAARAAVSEFTESKDRLDTMRLVVGDAVRESVPPIIADVMGRIGLDITNPEPIRKDLAHLRHQREAIEQVRQQAFTTLTKYAVTGFITILIAGIVALLAKHGYIVPTS